MLNQELGALLCLFHSFEKEMVSYFSFIILVNLF